MEITVLNVTDIQLNRVGLVRSGERCLSRLPHRSRRLVRGLLGRVPDSVRNLLGVHVRRGESPWKWELLNTLEAGR